MSERLLRAQSILESLKRGALRRDGERLLRDPMQRVDSLRSRLNLATRQGLEISAQRLTEAKANHRAIHPLRVIERREEHLKSLRFRLERIGSEGFERQEKRLANLKALLRTLGPESAFQRGFSITLTEDGEILRSVTQVKPGEILKTKIADGEVISRTEK
jgi:exodeoxyribonuclease VII large subunit